jgi:hypothetical protein
MPYRTFVDSKGTDWQVWDIVPRLSERRADDVVERRLADVEIPFANRRRDARRLTDSRRAVLRGTYAQGWLCFDSGREKRRLSPIPQDWLTCSPEVLERYFRNGERVTGSYHAIADHAIEPFAEAG